MPTLNGTTSTGQIGLPVVRYVWNEVWGQRYGVCPTIHRGSGPAHPRAGRFLDQPGSAKYRDDAPRVVDFPLGGQCFIFDGGDYFWPLGLEVASGRNYAEYSWNGYTFESMRPGCYNPKERLADMAIDGIDAAALFPSVGMRMRSPKALKNRDFGLALVRTYNEGIWEWCQEGDPTRLIPLAVIPGFGVDTAVAELEYALGVGFKAVFLTTLPNGTGQPEPRTTHFGLVAKRLSVVVNIHQGLVQGDEVGIWRRRAESWEPQEALRLMDRAARGVVAGRSGVRIVKDWLPWR